MPTPIPSKIIPSGSQSRQQEVSVFGEMAAGRYQGILFHLMGEYSGGEYNGGVWEMHEFENGAVVWVFPKDGEIQTRTLNGYDPKCSMRTLSIALNMIVMSILMSKLAEQKPLTSEAAAEIDKILNRMIQNFELTKDVGLSLGEYKAFLDIID